MGREPRVAGESCRAEEEVHLNEDVGGKLAEEKRGCEGVGQVLAPCTELQTGCLPPSQPTPQPAEDVLLCPALGFYLLLRRTLGWSWAAAAPQKQAKGDGLRLSTVYSCI
jgi:hypothetical protein